MNTQKHFSKQSDASYSQPICLRRVGSITLALAAILLGFAGLGHAQSLSDLYRITDDVSHYHVEYHQLSIAMGKEALLTDLKGPGKITYFYITDDTQVHWYPGLVLKVFWDNENEPSIHTAGGLLWRHGRQNHRLSILAHADQSRLLYVLSAHAIFETSQVSLGE